jgi:hypothetical protein
MSHPPAPPRWQGTALSLLLLVGLLVGGRGIANSSFTLNHNLVAPSNVSLATDAPDPAVVAAPGQYTVFTTEVGHTNVPVWSSHDFKTFTPVGDALPVLPAWAAPGYTWAPAVAHLGSHYVLYFSDAVRGMTARNGQPMKCLGVATSTKLTGPYAPRPEPLLCDTAHGGTIDPSVFVDGSGQPWLLSKRDGNSSGLPTVLESRRLASDGLGFTSGAYPLLTNAPSTWEGGVIEGPSMSVIGGSLYLLYSGGDWTTAGYGQGAAICTSPRGGCRRSLRVLDSRDGTGAGGGSTFPLPGGQTGLAFHSWQGPIRVLHMGQLQPGWAGVLTIGTAAVDPVTLRGTGRWGITRR